MTRSFKGGRRPVIYWATCPECLTYIWVAESSVSSEETITCPYCDSPMALQGGARLAESCNQLQGILEDIERQISSLPTAIDVHRFISEQVSNIASSFNERLDEIQEAKDSDLDREELEARHRTG